MLDVLKKKMRQTKEEMERYKEECEDFHKKLQMEVMRREEVCVAFSPMSMLLRVLSYRPGRCRCGCRGQSWAVRRYRGSLSELYVDARTRVGRLRQYYINGVSTVYRRNSIPSLMTHRCIPTDYTFVTLTKLSTVRLHRESYFCLLRFIQSVHTVMGANYWDGVVLEHPHPLNGVHRNTYELV